MNEPYQFARTCFSAKFFQKFKEMISFWPNSIFIFKLFPLGARGCSDNLKDFYTQGWGRVRNPGMALGFFEGSKTSLVAPGFGRDKMTVPSL